MPSSSPPRRKLTPSSFQSKLHKTIVPTSGHTYFYHLSTPSPSNTNTNQVTPTIILFHGFPDLGFGWRNQIPFLTSLGFQVVVPNLLGYAETSAPSDPRHYTYKSLSRDICELLQHINPALTATSSHEKREGNGKQTLFVGGHDWGGALAWRFAMWYPDLVKGVFSVCTPFGVPASPGTKYKHPASILPNFGYQLQFAGREVEVGVSSKEDVDGFLAGMFGGWSTAGDHDEQQKGGEGGKKKKKVPFDVRTGVDVELLKKGVAPSPLLTSDEREYYTRQYCLHEPPLQGPLNWYRVHEMNFQDEVEAGWGAAWRPPQEKEGGEERRKWEIPALWIAGSRDKALPPIMGKGMENWWRDGKDVGKGKKALRVKEVDASHWALWERPAEVNGIIRAWLEDVFDVVGGQKANL